MTWSVRTRIAVACLCCAVIPLVAYAAYTAVRASAALRAEQDQRFVEREIAVSRALDDLTVAELQAIGAYARWGRFAAALERADNKWLRGQLETLAAEAGGTASIYSWEGRLLLSSGRQAPTRTVWETAEVQDITDGVIVDMPAAGFETIEGRLTIVSAEAVAPPGRPDDVVGILAVVRPVAGQGLADVEAATDTGISIVASPSASELKGDLAIDASSGVLSQVGDAVDEGNDRTVRLAVFDSDGYRSGLVRMAMDQSSARSATNDLRTMAGVALVLAVLAALAAALLLSRRISGPLDRLAAAAVAIAGGETRQTIEAGRDDEIGRLAGAFNTMSERVTERVTELSGMLAGLTAEMAGLNVVFGHTLLDTVDLRDELGHMLPEVARLVRADDARLVLEGENGLESVAEMSGHECAEVEGQDGGGSPCLFTSAEANAVAARAVAEAEPLQSGEAGGPWLLAAPVQTGGSVGALLVARRGTAFDEEETALCSMLAGQLAVTVGNADAWRRLEASHLATVAALAGALSVKDEYAEAHPRTVSDVCDRLAEQLAMPATDRRLLRYAAILHDVGKIGVPERILRKPGPLTEEEFSVVAGHSIVGEHIVSQIDYLRPVGPVLRSVHERWDGLGYPDGIAGEEIPAVSRVLLAAHAYVAMTSDRPYRAALSHEAAVEEVLVNAGAQFDPDVALALEAAADGVRTAAAGLARREGTADRVLTTVLFVDLVGSTERAAELGDEAWKHELRRFHRVVTRELGEHRGTQIDAVGDGVFARFDGAARAVRCAFAIGRDLAPLGLRVRAGCHCGEVEIADGHVDGLAVHIGARVAALATPGEVLVSATVKDLVVGSGLSFVERGEHELRGVPGLWRLYAAGV